jgi:ABC-type uncharacterized transport system substrate-binding protein
VRLIVLSDPFLISQREKIASLARAQHVPVFANMVELTRVGGLLSYGPDYIDHFRRAAYFVDRILKGAKPGDLPIEQAATFALVVNQQDCGGARHQDPARDPGARHRGDRMKRREWLFAAGALAAMPLARAQSERVRRIGILVPSAYGAGKVPLLSKGLAALGWVEGRNLSIEVRNAEAHLERLPALAAELVRLKVDLIVTVTTPATRVVKAAAGRFRSCLPGWAIRWHPNSWRASRGPEGR